MSSRDGDKAKETAFVVLFKAVNIISGEGGGLRGLCGESVQVAWDFDHPHLGKDVVVDSRGVCVL